MNPPPEPPVPGDGAARESEKRDGVRGDAHNNKRGEKWRERSLLPGRWGIAALTLSLALHAALFLAAPAVRTLRLARDQVRFDAVIVPALLPAPPARTAAKTRPRPRKPLGPARPRLAPPAAVAPRSEDLAPVLAAATESDAALLADLGNLPIRAITDGAATAPIAPSATTASVAAAPAADASLAIATRKTAKTSQNAEADASRADAAPAFALPSRVSIAYRATSALADGVADYSWKRDGNQYETESTLQASGFFAERLLGTLYSVSRGEIGATGLKPSRFSIRRGDREADNADFQYAAGQLLFSRGSEVRTEALPARIQDTQSFLFQLAYDAQKLRTSDDRLDLTVTNGRKVYRHRFKRVGEESIETRLGEVKTVHLLSEAADPEDVYEVWLSPAHFFLPVKLKFFAGRFAVELIAANVRSTP